MDPIIFIFLAFAALLGILLWIYDHGPKQKDGTTGRGGDFEE